MQPGGRYLQHQQAQSTPQSLMAARSSMLYAQQLQQQATLQSQLGMNSGGNNSLHMLHSDASVGGIGSLTARGFPDFGGRNTGEGLQSATSRGMTGAGKQDVGSAGSAEGRGSNTGRNTDGGEALYLKGSEEEAN